MNADERQSRNREKAALFVREAGGLGDIVCCVAVVEQWAREWPAFRADFLTLPCYRALASLGLHAPNARVLAMPPNVRRGRMHEPAETRLEAYWRYCEVRPAYAGVFDFWCPADAHEKATRGRPRLSRLESFFSASGFVLDRVRPARFTIPEPALASARELFEATGRERPWVVIVPHTAHGSKDWPLDRWQAVADAIGREHCLAPTVKAGSAWRGKLDGVPYVFGLGHVRLAAVLHEADLVLCGDTGPMHIAAACQTPKVALFGPTDGDAMTRHYPTVIPIQGVPPGDGCHAPCLRYLENGYERCRDKGLSACLEAIEPEQIIEAARAALAVGAINEGLS